MKRLPPRISVPESADEISSEVKKLLKAAGVGQQLPTPKPDILTCAQLIETGELDLEDYRQTASDRLLGFLGAGLSKVVGLLDFRRRVVYVDPTATPTRRNFVTYHEVIHRTLPWQRMVYASDDNSTVDPRCETIFESEANYGAAEILFQGNRFEIEACDFPIGLDTVQYLARRYDASCHATFRRFVERNGRACMLLVLKKTAYVNDQAKHSYFLVYTVESSRFIQEFGDPFGGLTFLGPDHEIAMVIDAGATGEIRLVDFQNATKSCSVEVFDNHHHVFVLLWPAGSRNRGRRVIFRG